MDLFKHMLAKALDKVKELESLVTTLRAEIAELINSRQRLEREKQELIRDNVELGNELEYYRNEDTEKKHRQWYPDKEEEFFKFENKEYPSKFLNSKTYTEKEK